MPTYRFVCNNEIGGCGNVYDIDLSMSEITDYKAKCPECKKKVSYQDFSGVAVFGPYKTLGTQADRNDDRMSDDEKAFIHEKNNAYKKKPFTGRLPKGAIDQNGNRV